MTDKTNTDNEPEVLEAEFEEADSSAGSPPEASLAKRPRRLPWYLIALLLAFIAGLFAFPYAERALMQAGLLPAQDADIAQPQQDLSPLRQADQAMGQRLTALETALAALSDETVDLRGRLANMRLDGNTISEGATDTEGLSVLRDEVRAQADQLAERMQIVERLVAEQTNSAPAAGVSEEQLSLLRQVVQQTRDDQAAFVKQLETLAGRMTQIEAIDRSIVAGPLFSVSVLELARKIDSGVGFGSDLLAIKASLADQPMRLSAALIPLTQLDPLAPKGVLRHDELTRRFAPLAPEVLRLAIVEKEEGLVARVGARLGNIVTVRPTGVVAGDDPAAIIARAEAALAAQDLATAVAELGALPSAAQAPLDNWMAAAQDRLKAMTAAAALINLAQDAVLSAPASAQTGPTQGDDVQ